MATVTRTTRSTRKGFQLASDIGRPDLAIVCTAICRAATSYQRVQEALCNGPHWAQQNIPQPEYGKRMDRWQKRTEAEDARIEARLRKLASGLGDGYGLVLNGDPRGSCVKITTPDGRTNDWGKEGICIPD